MGRAHLGVLAALALCCLAVAGGQGSATPGGTVGPVSVRAMNPSSGNGSAATEPAGVHHRALEASADWPTFACDPANTGHNPVATGPGRPVTAAWNTTIAGRSMSPVVVGETAYVPSDSGLFAVDRATGTVRWRAEGAYVGHPAVRNGSLYVVSGDTLSAPATGDRRPTPRRQTGRRG